MNYFFDRDYEEYITLKDGKRAHLRCIRPEDKHHLVEGLQHMSEASKYRRFFTIKSNLTESELAFLTEVDGVNHFAMGAEICNDGRRFGVGVARFIRDKEDERVAEPAIVVIDEEQGNGLGHWLFLRLVAAARERGICSFHCEILATNDPVRNLLNEIPTVQSVRRMGSEELIDMALPEVRPDATDYDDVQANPFREITRSIQSGGLTIKNRLNAMFQGRRK